jgi:hypothetical protein
MFVSEGLRTALAYRETVHQAFIDRTVADAVRGVATTKRKTATSDEVLARDVLDALVANHEERQGNMSSPN